MVYGHSCQWCRPSAEGKGNRMLDRRHLIDRLLLLSPRLKLPMKVEVSHAVEMPSTGRRLINSAIIADCFWKAGPSLCEEIENDPSESGKSELLDWWNAELASVEQTNYINSDHRVIATEELINDHVIDSVRYKGNAAKGDDSALDDELPPSIAEVLKSTNTIT